MKKKEGNWKTAKKRNEGEKKKKEKLSKEGHVRKAVRTTQSISGKPLGEIISYSVLLSISGLSSESLNLKRYFTPLVPLVHSST